MAKADSDEMVEENGNEKASHWFGGGEDDEKEVDDGDGQNQRTVERKEEGNQKPGDGVDNVGRLKPDDWDGESAAFGDAAMSWRGAKHVEERRGVSRNSRAMIIRIWAWWSTVPSCGSWHAWRRSIGIRRCPVMN